jgi:hypothetical protein
MKRLILTEICLLVFLSASAQEKKVLRGFDGGMMVHRLSDRESECH